VRAARNPESYARIILTRGEGPLGLDPALAQTPLRVILVEPLVPLSVALYREGAKLSLVQTSRAADAAPGTKVSNYLGSLLAIMPEGRVEARVIGDGRPGAVTRRVHAAFRRRVGLGGEAMPWEQAP